MPAVDLSDAPDDVRVVDGVRELVAADARVVRDERDVEDEALAGALLLGKGPVEAEQLEAADLDYDLTHGPPARQ